MSAKIPPQDAIDRDHEKQALGTMLGFPDDARLLVIEERGGNGKSTLLSTYRFVCRRDRVPVSLVLLNEEPDTESGNRSPITNEHELVKWIRQDLRLPFPLFDFADDLHMRYLVAPPVRDAAADLSGLLRREGVDLDGRVDVGRVSGGVVAGLYVNELRIEARSGWANPEQEAMASRRCVEAFQEDLRAICRTQRVVLLFDSYEKRHRGIGEWLFEEFIEPLTLAPGRAEKLVVVLAVATDKGPPLRDLLREDADRLTRCRTFQPWGADHVREFLDLHGYKNLPQDQFQFICSQIKKGWTLRRALIVASTLQEEAA